MAPVSLENEVRYAPLLVAVSHVAAVVYLTFTVSLGLYQSYKGLSPSQDTRLRIHKRRVLAPMFGGLSLAALASDAYHKLGYLTLSYKVWAHERGIAFPASVFRTTLNGSTRAPLYLSRWLTDTPIYLDAAEIVAEKARRFWWGNQINLATVPWSLLLAIEGRRRKIPYLWAYMLLTHLVNLSFAQNLFFLALLLTPSPPETGVSPGSRLSRTLSRFFPSSTPNWIPGKALSITYILASYGLQAMLPYTAGTPSFSLISFLSHILAFAPLLFPSSSTSSPHTSYPLYKLLFRLSATASAVLHLVATTQAITYNIPASYKHRHSVHIPFDVQRRTNWERTTTAVGKVLGSIGDHPVVAAAAWDVVICAISLGIWAAVRAVDVDHVLACVLPGYGDETTDVVTDESVKQETPVKEESGEVETPTVRRSGRSGRPSSRLLEKGVDDGSASVTKRKGRPRKVKTEPENEIPDAAYTPTPKVAEEVVEGDRMEGEDDWEACAVVWGVTVVGGLGAGAAGVFGGECIAR